MTVASEQTGDSSRWLPTSRDELDARGWDEVDVILVSGDAYVDHPSFGAAVVGRMIEREGLRVAILPQPNWRDDLRDFRKLGRPRLFFGVTAGCMDSMVNHYTAARRLRSDDAYTPGDQAGFRPDYAVTVYTRILKQLYPDVPVMIGGIEASLRRVTHFDYWSDTIKPSVLADSGADLLVYGMGELPLLEILRLLGRGVPFASLRTVPQTAVLLPPGAEVPKNQSWEDLTLHSHEECVRNRASYAANFGRIETESNRVHARRLRQEVGGRLLVVNPPFPTMTTAAARRESRPAVHAPAASALPQARAHPGVRDDQALDQPAPGLLRRVQLLHDLRAPGEIRGQPQPGEHPARGAGGDGDARFPRHDHRSRRSVGQHVPDAGPRSEPVRRRARSRAASGRASAPTSTRTIVRCSKSTGLRVPCPG